MRRTRTADAAPAGPILLTVEDAAVALSIGRTLAWKMHREHPASGEPFSLTIAA